MSRLSLVHLGICLGLLVGCGSNPPPDETTPAATSVSSTTSTDSSDATVRVDNRAFADLSIFVVYNTQRIRLGVAIGNSVTTLRIPPYVVSSGPASLRFAADPIGGRHAVLTEPIVVQKGDEVSLMIPN